MFDMLLKLFVKIVLHSLLNFIGNLKNHTKYQKKSENIAVYETWTIPAPPPFLPQRKYTPRRARGFFVSL